MQATSLLLPKALALGLYYLMPSQLIYFLYPFSSFQAIFFFDLYQKLHQYFLSLLALAQPLFSHFQFFT
jgi:hypothetical protein